MRNAVTNIVVCVPNKDIGVYVALKVREKVIVFRQIKGGIGIEHAAKNARHHSQQSHQRKVQPVHSDSRRCSAHQQRKICKHTARQTDHNPKKQDNVSSCCRFGAGFILLGIEEVTAEYLCQLFFQKNSQHDSQILCSAVSELCFISLIRSLFFTPLTG